MPDRRRPTMFPALLIAAVVPLTVLFGQVPRADSTRATRSALMTSDSSKRTFSPASRPSRRKLEVAFTRESYRPGETATLRLWGGDRELRVQLFRCGPERIRTRGNDRMEAFQ
jgi:hypothetical protein